VVEVSVGASGGSHRHPQARVSDDLEGLDVATVGPAVTECTPQESLPIMPPSVQYWWVDGSGPKVRWCCSASPRRRSSTAPGSTRARRRSVSTSRTRSRWREKSRTTAALQLCPAWLVPAPWGERARRAPGKPRGRQHILDVARLHNSDRKLPVDRRVRRVERPVPRGEADLAPDRSSQICGELERGLSRHPPSLSRAVGFIHWRGNDRASVRSWLREYGRLRTGRPPVMLAPARVSPHATS